MFDLFRNVAFEARNLIFLHSTGIYCLVENTVVKAYKENL